MMNRREAIHAVAATGGGSPLLSSLTAALAAESAVMQIIDTNVSLFHWPFRRLPLDDTNVLVKKLRSLGVTQALAGSFEGLLHRDVATVNQRLADECAKHQVLTPIGTVNPILPAWKEDLLQCKHKHQMPGIRLHPNYHGYDLKHPNFTTLLNYATRLGVFVQIATAMEDNRTQHSMLQVPNVDLAPLASCVGNMPGVRVQLLNHRMRLPQPKELAATPGIYFDTARIDGTDGIPGLMAALPNDRVMHGTHAPFLIPEAALIRCHESGTLDQQALKAVLSQNASRFLESSSI